MGQLLSQYIKVNQLIPAQTLSVSGTTTGSTYYPIADWNSGVVVFNTTMASGVTCTSGTCYVLVASDSAGTSSAIASSGVIIGPDSEEATTEYTRYYDIVRNGSKPYVGAMFLTNDDGSPQLGVTLVLSDGRNVDSDNSS